MAFPLSHAPPSAGFTLLETVLTLMLLAILSLYAVMRWPATEDPRGRAEQVAGAVRLTQTLAMSRGGVWQWVPLSPGGYRIQDPDNRVVQEGTLGGVFYQTTPAILRFDTQGRLLAGDGDLVLTDGQTWQTLRIEAATGAAYLP